MSRRTSGPDLEDVALFDMDGTLCDFEARMLHDLELLRAPGELPLTEMLLHGDHTPRHLEERMKLIKAASRWWAELPRYLLGWDVLHAAQALKYQVMILTQAPRDNPAASAGKIEWIMRHMGPGVDVTLTRDKGLVYGKVLVDDYPTYVQRWLKHRKNGLVILPANAGNADFSHPNAIRYDGNNLDQVREALVVAKGRSSGEPLRL